MLGKSQVIVQLPLDFNHELLRVEGGKVAKVGAFGTSNHTDYVVRTYRYIDQGVSGIWKS